MRLFDAQRGSKFVNSESQKGRKTAGRAHRFLSAAAAGVICLSLVLTSVSGDSISKPVASTSAAGMVSLASETQNSAALSDAKIPVQPSVKSETAAATTAAAASATASTTAAASTTSAAATTAPAVTALSPTQTAQTSQAAEKLQTAVTMPAAEFTGHTDEKKENQVTVTAKAPEGAFPAGTTMQVKAVDDSDVLSKAQATSGLEEGQAKTDAANTTKIVKKSAVEITFHDAEGKEIEPQKAIQVSMSCSGLSDAEGDPQIVHINDSGKAETVKQIPEKDLAQKPADDEVVFSAESFSVYAVVYTVRFNYGNYEYVLPGEESVMLSDLLSDLKIPGDDEGTLLAVNDIQKVSFSDPSLVTVTKQNDDWKLSAVSPFSTNETLSLTRSNGDTITVGVTDDNSSSEQKSDHDLTGYITTVTADKKNNGQWEPAQEFVDGDAALIQIDYKLAAGVITAENRIMTYKLPSGVDVPSGTNGNITDPNDNTKIVGKFTIDKDGIITLVFNSDMVGKEFRGDVKFESTVHNNSDNSENEIKFANSDQATIKVLKKYDISTAKKYALNDDGEMVYTIEVSTKNGTDGPVTIKDSVDQYNTENATFQYDGNITIEKKSADGTRTAVTGFNPKFEGTDKTSEFTIDNLPQLSAGEKYVVTYKAKVQVQDSNKYSKVVNKAESKDKSNHDYGGYSIREIHPPVQKDGHYDSSKNQIYWKITLNQDKVADISNWEINDDTPAEIVGDVTISNGNWQPITTIKDFKGKKTIDIKISDYLKPNNENNDKKGTYYIEYYTKVSNENQEKQYHQSNTVTVTENNKKIGESTKVVEGEYQQANVTKNNNGADTSKLKEGKLYPKWNFNVTVPAEKVSSIIYTDTIGEVTGIEDAVQYTTAAALDSQLKEHLELTVDDNTSYLYVSEDSTHLKTSENGQSKEQESNDIHLKVNYYDADNNIVPASNTETHIKKFEVEVSAKEGKTFTARQLKTTQDYSTTVEFPFSEMKEGDTLTASNKGSAFNIDSTPQYSYTKPKRFSKQVLQKGENNSEEYVSGTSTADYDAVNGVLKYRLMLTTNETDDGKDIVITDKLPGGTKLVDGSVTAKFYKDQYNKFDSNWGGTDFAGNNKPNVVVSTSDKDGTTPLTITIPKYKFKSGFETIAITYSVSITDDPIWKDLKNTTQTYVNNAKWGSNEDSTTTTVNREIQQIAKSGEQVKDANGNLLSRIRYTVVINPTAADLDENSATLTLTDKLTGADKFNPRLDISSLKLYNYDPDKEDHIGTPLAETSYTMNYDMAQPVINMTIPDSKALILAYEYSLDDTIADSFEVSNDISLNGNWSSNKKFSVESQSASAHASTPTITVYKVDSRNNQITIPGATFKLEQYDKAGSWSIKSEKLITDSDGKIQWNDKDLEQDKLYRLTEVNPPDGYQLDATQHYIIWESKTSGKDAAYSAAVDDKAGVTKDKINFFVSTGGIMYITNTYTRVGVQKVWTKKDGSETNAPENVKVAVQLYQQKLVPDGYTVNIKSLDKNYQSYYQKEIVVEKNTALTIKFKDSDSKAQQDSYQVICGDEKHTMTRDDQGDFIFTVQVDKPNIELSIVSPYDGWAPTVTPTYTEAPKKITQTAYGDPVILTLSNTGKLSCSWNNLPQSDVDGKPCYYKVEEVSVTQGKTNITSNYETTYSNNDGIQSGQIIITNTEKNEQPKEYVLPESGGTGIDRYIGSGIALTLTAMFLYIFRLEEKRRKSTSKR